ncbi:MAG: hypothetical protein OHM77_09440 [Candidatus Nitricoxidivorans perseverans]|uniref:Uncharacterized protein n=1 Tax=Candidatus Nitricoxidivorans perseverans TaxID=2975601 RepID=A0AA49IXZ7_9PROT|nr:MAG: hypothetical protein OHM77_09440 [Candidatus Nitricoxidivorans perseverans]
MRARFLWCAAWLGCLPISPCWAGEIIIIEPAPQGSRSERESERAKEKARQRAGKARSGETVIITDGPAENRTTEQAEQLGREAQEYLRPPSSDATADGTATIILRAAPPGDAEKARMKARAYVAPALAKTKECASVTNQVGMIGEGPGAERSANVVEKGSSTVNLQAQCR